ncbi:thiamine phosphate synthase [Legionella sp. CNM-4043-24]|uniref:thiamine phosphate synthase n=1 Tax=Legionella sp. CNM-4043-24 TaxID=3421646 RepID=UPI00403A9883
MSPDFLRLMLVTHKQDIPLTDYLAFIRRCAASGLTSIQLREKQASQDDLRQMGRALLAITRPLGIALIINDNLELALELDADGLHLGQSDGDPVAARALLGPDKWLGVSIDSMDNLHLANELPVDYVGVGAIFPTNSKSNVSRFWGIDGLQKAADLSRHPIIAIGGLDENNTREVMLAGASGVAAIEAFHSAEDPEQCTRNLRAIIETCRTDT